MLQNVMNAIEGSINVGNLIWCKLFSTISAWLNSCRSSCSVPVFSSALHKTGTAECSIFRVKSLLDSHLSPLLSFHTNYVCYDYC